MINLVTNTAVQFLMYDVFLLFSVLLYKHFIVDFVTQRPYYFLNKGKFGHPGGVLHSLEHAVATAIVLFLIVKVNKELIFTLASFEFVIHYLIDFTKVKINDKFNLKSDNKQFWYLLGLDQYLHQLTYVVITFIAIVKG